MKLFKKALVATAIVGSFAASAATVSSTPDTVKVSKEGAALGVAASDSILVLDVVVTKDHPASSVITLAFDENVELGTLADETDLNGCTGPVDNGISAGQGTCGSILFDYGTGSFTFDDVVIVDGDASEGETDSISFKVNLGNKLGGGSAFRVTIGTDHAVSPAPETNEAVLVMGESWVTYSSVLGEDSIGDDGVTQIAEEVSQFSFGMVRNLNGLIEREDQDSFVNLDSTTTDRLEFFFEDNDSLELALDVTDASVEFSGDFEGVEAWSSNAAEVGTLSYEQTTGTSPVTIKVINELTGTGPVWSGDDSDLYIDFTNDGAVIPETGTVSAVALITGATNNVEDLDADDPIVVGTDDTAGEWALDATIINVPYFPVNIEGVDSSVHFANEGSRDSAVMITIIDHDEDGAEYTAKSLPFMLAAETVTKVKQKDITDLFEIEGTAKLSVTFNIDADEEDISAYAFTQKDGQGRSEVSNSQLKGKSVPSS